MSIQNFEFGGERGVPAILWLSVVVFGLLLVGSVAFSVAMLIVVWCFKVAFSL